MTSSTISREQRIYLALWRKAQLDPSSPVQIRASSFSTGLTMRQGLYKAIRPYRFGLLDDPVLAKASERFVVSLTKNEDPKSIHILTLKPRLSLNELEASLLDLGLDEEDLLLPSEKKLFDEVASMSGPADSPKPTKPSNPFYSREG